MAPTLTPVSSPLDVPWPILNGLHPKGQRNFTASPELETILTAVDDVAQADDVWQLTRRAVEVCREVFYLDRVAIFLFTDERMKLQGTWGTTLQGNTVDERFILFPAGFHHRKASNQALAGVSRWMVFWDAPLFEHRARDPFVCGRGWNVLTPILGHRNLAGLIVNDSARYGATLDPVRQAQLAIFARLLGGLIEAHDRRSNHPSALARGIPTLGNVDHRSLVVSSVRALDEDPTLSGKDLGRLFAISPTVLATAFHREMGLSLVEYRNRIRLERFIDLLPNDNGKYLVTALDAGFGSYAQFHRVFTQTFGVSPQRYFMKNPSLRNDDHSCSPAPAG